MPRSRIVPALLPASLSGVPCLTTHSTLRRDRRRARLPRQVFDDAAIRGKYYHDARGKYRIFETAGYRFYRSNAAPPAEGDTVWATAETLPDTPTDTFADGTWYLSVSYYNGLIDSGFLPIGEHGETYLVLRLSGGAETATPPDGPVDWRLELQPAGVVRVVACLLQYGDNRADQWAIAYSTDGSTPAEDTPDETEDLFGDANLAILSYDLTGQDHGTTIKVRLQTRRNDGTDSVPVWVYSDGSSVKTATADATGPGAPTGGDWWRGAVAGEEGT